MLVTYQGWQTVRYAAAKKSGISVEALCKWGDKCAAKTGDGRAARASNDQDGHVNGYSIPIAILRIGGEGPVDDGGKPTVDATREDVLAGVEELLNTHTTNEVVALINNGLSLSAICRYAPPRKSTRKVSEEEKVGEILPQLARADLDKYVGLLQGGHLREAAAFAAGLWDEANDVS